ncbi:hypothetical protein FACS189432_01020 [Bacteroidia bacterium]|nr:hypothetical protein FACS189426_03280 [Bacteroidia bacterium]GHT26499.1 hypothetical protein FACS189432_01020 [Bacteroidia bacterium]
MKSIERVLLILSGCTLIGVSILLTNSFRKENVVEDKSLKAEQEIEQFYYEQNIYAAVENNDISINVTPIQNQINYNQPTLVCRYSANACSICIDFAIDKLNEFFPDSENNTLPVLIIVSDLSSDKKIKKYSNKTINIAKNNLEMPIEETYLPFYFIMYQGKAQQIFIPEKNYPKYTDTYLKAIKKRYFSE